MCLSSIKNATKDGLIGQVFGFGDKGGGNSASKEAARARAETQQREEEKNARIGQGRQAIDSAFSQFGDPYFQDFQNAYTTNYNQSLDDQFASARDQLIAQLAARGMTESSVGAGKIGDLQKRYGDERAAIGNRAADEANSLKSQIEQQRAALYQTNNQAADPSTIATQATGAATALKAPRQFGELGQIFADFLGPIGGGVAADRNSANPTFGFNKQPQVYSRAGSGRVVG
jgi:hypothetical protein